MGSDLWVHLQVFSKGGVGESFDVNAHLFEVLSWMTIVKPDLCVLFSSLQPVVEPVCLHALLDRSRLKIQTVQGKVTLLLSKEHEPRLKKEIPLYLTCDEASNTLYVSHLNESISAVDLDSKICKHLAYVILPKGTALHKKRNKLYVASAAQFTIQAVDLTPPHTMRIIAGSLMTRGFVDGFQGVSKMYKPYGLWLDESRELLYFTDLGNSAIRRIHLQHNNYVETITHGHFTIARAIVGNPFNSKELFVSDSESLQLFKVTITAAEQFDEQGRMLTFSGNFSTVFHHHASVLNYVTVESIAGSPEGIRGHVDGVGSEVRFNELYGLYANDNTLYITDGSSIRKMDITTNRVTTITTDNKLEKAGGISGSSKQRCLFVADNAIFKIN